MKRIQRKANSGQAMIEFILGMMITMSFFVFYLKLSAVFAVANYIHYATFMAARAYSSSAPAPDEQQLKGEDVLKKMVKDRFKAVIKESSNGIYVGEGPYFQENPKLNYWNQGATYSFNAKVSLYPWSNKKQSIVMDLTSESWMPRNVTIQECEALKKAIQPGPGAKVEWDNGC